MFTPVADLNLWAYSLAGLNSIVFLEKFKQINYCLKGRSVLRLQQAIRLGTPCVPVQKTGHL